MSETVKRCGAWVCVQRDGYWFKRKDGQWWHWDETQSRPFGPFKTLREARRFLAEYVRSLA